MRLQLVLFTLITALCAGRASNATSLVLNVSGTIVGTKFFFPDGPDTGPLSGTVTFDLATGYATSANIIGTLNGRNTYFSFIDAAIPVAPPFPVIGPVQAPATDYSYVQNGFTTVDLVEHFGGGGGNELNFTVSDALLTNPSGDPFTLNSGTIHAYESTSGNYYIRNGLLSPQSSVTPTPEPSSLLLLGTGSIGLIAVVRRRFFNA